jgi:hypothetical protein
MIQRAGEGEGRANAANKGYCSNNNRSVGVIRIAA